MNGAPTASTGLASHVACEITTAASRIRDVLLWSASKPSGDGVRSPSRACAACGAAAAVQTGPVARHHRCRRTGLYPEAAALPQPLEHAVPSRLWPLLRHQASASTARGGQGSPLVSSWGTGQHLQLNAYAIVTSGCISDIPYFRYGDCTMGRVLVGRQPPQGGSFGTNSLALAVGQISLKPTIDAAGRIPNSRGGLASETNPCAGSPQQLQFRIYGAASMQVSFPYALRGCPNIGQRAPPLRFPAS